MSFALIIALRYLFAGITITPPFYKDSFGTGALIVYHGLGVKKRIF